ncbi:adenylate/guanylate cyclase domain-containing protein [Breznakiellaceae bacterium SP9]
MNDNLFETFFRCSQDSMFICTRDGRLIETNASFEKLLGFGREELLELRLVETFNSNADYLAYQAVIDKSRVVHQYPIVLKQKDKSPLPCLLDAVAWVQNDVLMGYLGIIRSRDNMVNSFKKFFSQLQNERNQIKEERKKLLAETMLIFHYANDDVLEYVSKTGNNPLENVKRKVSILFFDIRGSSLLAERIGPDVFAALLNDVLMDIMDLVCGCRGSVNKLIGDGLMATFGAPIATGNDAVNAVQAAQEIINYLNTFNDVRPDYLSEPLRAGVGIATGMVFAGVIGSIRRQEYTVLGDSVNIASRLESLTKSAPEKVLMDEETYDEVKDSFPCRKVFTGKLRGRLGTMLIYGLTSSKITAE